jgi:hypothetical protein
MNVIFKTQSGQIQPGKLSKIELSEFKSVAQQLFGSIENVRFLVRGKQINTEDAAKFNEQKDLFKENCVIQLVQRMKGGYLRIYSK